MSLLLLAACAHVADPEDSAPAPVVTPAIAVDPALVDFGLLPVGATDSRDVTVSNTGDATLSLLGLVLEANETPFALGAIGASELAPGSSTSFPVTFVATAAGTAAARIALDSDAADTPRVEIVLLGEGVVPELVLDPSGYDFGVVSVACTDTHAVSVRNDGGAPLTVTAVAASGGQGAFGVDADEIGNGPLPWTLAPGDSRQVWVSFSPPDDQAYAGTLVVRSDDPTTPAAATALDGMGLADPRVRDSFLTKGTPIDVLVAMGGADPDTLAAELVANVTSFTTPFTDAHADFQLVGLRADDGCVETPLAVDGRMTADEQSDALGDHFAVAAETAPHTLTLLQLAIAQAGPGGCNEGFVREGARLLLVGLTDEAAAAPQPHGLYESLFEGTKLDPDDVAASAIAPDGGTCGALDDTWDLVATGTGGTYTSVCDDLATTLADLAGDALDRQVSFGLSAIPWPDTLVVTVDGDWSHAWTYDPVDNAVVFDADALPTIGSPVSAIYDAVPVCEN
jgi:hypothetical protein